MLLRGPPGIPIEDGREHLEEVFFAFTLGGNGVVKGRIDAVEGSALHGVGQDFDGCREGGASADDSGTVDGEVNAPLVIHVK